MQVATDVDRRPDPNNFKDFEEDGHSYNALFWSGYGDLPGGVKNRERAPSRERLHAHNRPSPVHHFNNPRAKTVEGQCRTKIDS